MAVEPHRRIELRIPAFEAPVPSQRMGLVPCVGLEPNLTRLKGGPPHPMRTTAVMVGVRGLKPRTSAVSTRRSLAELNTRTR